MGSVKYLVGTWHCTYHAGSQRIGYTATYAYDMGTNWMRESDSWKGGGQDESLLTYDPKMHAWTAVVMESQRATTLFRAKGDDSAHLTYRSVYPSSSFTNVFDRESQREYTLHFSGKINGRQVSSFDTCTKV